MQPFLGVRQVAQIGISALEKGLEEHAIQSASPGQSFVPRAQKSETERRLPLHLGQKLAREVLMRTGYCHQDERPPAHAE